MDVREGTTGDVASGVISLMGHPRRDTELCSVVGRNVIGTMSKWQGEGAEDEGRVIRHLPFHYSCFAGETAARHAIARSILPLVFVRATGELGKIASHYAHVDHASLKHRRATRSVDRSRDPGRCPGNKEDSKENCARNYIFDFSHTCVYYIMLLIYLLECFIFILILRNPYLWKTLFYLFIQIIMSVSMILDTPRTGTDNIDPLYN